MLSYIRMSGQQIKLNSCISTFPDYVVQKDGVAEIIWLRCVHIIFAITRLHVLCCCAVASRSTRDCHMLFQTEGPAGRGRHEPPALFSCHFEKSAAGGRSGASASGSQVVPPINRTEMARRPAPSCAESDCIWPGEIGGGSLITADQVDKHVFCSFPVPKSECTAPVEMNSKI